MFLRQRSKFGPLRACIWRTLLSSSSDPHSAQSRVQESSPTSPLSLPHRLHRRYRESPTPPILAVMVAVLMLRGEGDPHPPYNLVGAV